MLVSQNGKMVCQFRNAWLDQTFTDKHRIMHDGGNTRYGPDNVATYKTEPEAMAQLNGVALAAERGQTVYRFD